jgi:hypothetical protein
MIHGSVVALKATLAIDLPVRLWLLTPDLYVQSSVVDEMKWMKVQTYSEFGFLLLTIVPPLFHSHLVPRLEV